MCAVPRETWVRYLIGLQHQRRGELDRVRRCVRQRAARRNPAPRREIRAVSVSVSVAVAVAVAVAVPVAVCNGHRVGQHVEQ
eukprot:1824492-Rhodomonas_salina.1